MKNIDTKFEELIISIAENNCIKFKKIHFIKGLIPLAIIVSLFFVLIAIQIWLLEKKILSGAFLEPSIIATGAMGIISAIFGIGIAITIILDYDSNTWLIDINEKKLNFINRKNVVESSYEIEGVKFKFNEFTQVKIITQIPCDFSLNIMKTEQKKIYDMLNSNFNQLP